MAPRRRRRKKQRMPEAAAADALMSLPSDILDTILGVFDLRDAARTSVLSRAWRRRWESLPSFDIFASRFQKQPPLSAVDSVLSRCSGRVRCFHVGLDDGDLPVSAARTEDWFRALSRVEELVVWGKAGLEFVPLPSTLFSCRRLVCLVLYECEVPPLPPGFEGFPDLEVLRLLCVDLQENGEYQLEKIIETSPLLEQLILNDVHIGGDGFKEWEIRAPNLRSLTIRSSIDYGCNLAEMPFLRSAAIDLLDYDGERDLARFLAGLGQVSKLDISTFEAPVNKVTILEALPWTFHNLKSFKFTMDFSELHPIPSCFFILRSAPNLEKLKILSYGGGREDNDVGATEEFLNSQWVDGMCAKLQVLLMIGVNWLPNEMSFMKFILSKAQLLRSLSVSHHDECLMSHDEPLHELQNCTRASAEAQILFKGPAGEY